jgi:hypothetical protein
VEIVLGKWVGWIHDQKDVNSLMEMNDWRKLEYELVDYDRSPTGRVVVGGTNLLTLTLHLSVESEESGALSLAWSWKS